MGRFCGKEKNKTVPVAAHGCINTERIRKKDLTQSKAAAFGALSRVENTLRGASRTEGGSPLFL